MARPGNPGHPALLWLATALLFLKNAAKEYRCLIALNRKRCGGGVAAVAAAAARVCREMLQSARDRNSNSGGRILEEFRIYKFFVKSRC
jgi:hypothetical protein